MNYHRTRLHGIERLEPRHLMAGNITATMIGDDLHINADDLDNTLTVQQNERNEVILRAAHPNQNVSDTRINGTDTSYSFVHFRNVTGSIFMNFYGGNDQLFIFHGRFEGTLQLDLGAGNDSVEISRFGTVSLGSEFLIQLADGDDRYFQTNTRVDEFQRLDGGSGNDQMTIDSSSIGEGLLVNGLAGFDAIRIEQSNIGGFTGLLGGTDADRIETVYSVFAEGVSILAGPGGDVVNSIGCRFDMTFFVALEDDFGIATVQGCIIETNAFMTAAGQSQLRFSSSVARRLEIATGPIDDVVIVEGSVLDEFYATLGEGNDRLRVIATRVELGGLFDGQGGRDSLFERGNLITGLGREGFEMVDIA